MQIESAGIYAILDSSRAFREWRSLSSGTEYNPNFVLSQTSEPKPNYNFKTQKLEENITVRETDVLQSWVVVNLLPEEIVANKRPDPVGFMREGFSGENTAMFEIYQKILAASSSNLVANTWFTQLMQASQPIFFTIGGWNTAIMQLASAVVLEPSERSLINQYLAKYDLDEVL